MAKTFDNISEASATNYLFIFSQRTLALQNEPPTPPPLNALGLPCKAICLLWDLLYPLLCPKDEAAAAVTAAALAVETTAVMIGLESLPLESRIKFYQEETPLIEVTAVDFPKTIEPLAKQITEYILNHQDDAAQEDRWRTTMKRDMGKSFRKVKEESDKQREAIDSRLQSMHEVHSKMDEKLDRIVKDLASRY